MLASKVRWGHDGGWASGWDEIVFNTKQPHRTVPQKVVFLGNFFNLATSLVEISENISLQFFSLMSAASASYDIVFKLKEVEGKNLIWTYGKDFRVASREKLHHCLRFSVFCFTFNLFFIVSLLVNLNFVAVCLKDFIVLKVLHMARLQRCIS